MNPADDDSVRASAVAALFGATIQREARLTTVTIALFTFAFVYSAAVIAAMTAHPDSFTSWRAALVPLPVWTLALVANLNQIELTANRRFGEQLQGQLSRAAGVAAPSMPVYYTFGGKLWILAKGLVGVAAACVFLGSCTWYCVSKAVDTGASWPVWAVVYGILVVLVFVPPRRAKDAQAENA